MSAMHSHEKDEMVYRIYVAESLRMIPQGKYYSKPYADIISETEERTADPREIVDDIVSRAGLVVLE